MEQKLLTATDLQRLGFSRNKTYAILHSKDIRTVRVGKRLYLDSNELARWLDARVLQEEGERNADQKAKPVHT